MPVKVKSSQTFPNETKSKVPRAASVKGLKKLSNQVLYKRNSKSSGLRPLRVQVSPPAPPNIKAFSGFCWRPFLLPNFKNNHIVSNYILVVFNLGASGSMIGPSGYINRGETSRKSNTSPAKFPSGRFNP